MRNWPAVANASAPYAARVATMAGRTRRISTPARAPMANAARVHAAKANPRGTNDPGSSGFTVNRAVLALDDGLPEAKYGWKYHEASALTTPVAAATTNPSATNL